jgi:hypothetical protein
VPVRTAYAMRCVMVRVLPVPAPARMHTGPRTARAASSCSGSSPARTASASEGSASPTRGILPGAGPGKTDRGRCV